MNDFINVKPLWACIQNVLPQVYDDTLGYQELLYKVISKLNELVENNNKLPDYIADLIREYISSGEIERVLAEVLATYMLNVKFPPAGLEPASGDGSKDDTEAIQGCIDYAQSHGGMAVYFPSGSYLCNSLDIAGKCTMFGYDRYNTRIVLKGGATRPLLNGHVDEFSLNGLGFDGNMDIQVNNVNLIDITVGSGIITNVFVTDGYDLIKAQVDVDLQISDVVFNHAVENGLVISGSGRVVVDNCVFRTVSALIGKRYVKFGVSNSVISNCVMVGSCPVGVEITGNMNRIQFDKGECVKGFVDSGSGNSVFVDGVEKSERLTGDAVENVGGYVRVTVQGDVTSTVAGNVVDSSMGKSDSVTGKRTVKSGSVDDSTTGVRSVKSQSETRTVDDDSIEVVGGDKSISAKSYHVSVNGEFTENVQGNKGETVVGDVTVDYSNNENVTVGGNKTETVNGIWQETAEGNKIDDVNGNYERHVVGRSVDNIDMLANFTYKSGVIKNVTGGDSENVAGVKKITADHIELNTDNPLKYGTISNKENYNTVPMVANSGIEYNIMVENDKTPLLANEFVSVKYYGAKGDGVSDDTAFIQEAINNSNGNAVFFPAGTYIVSATLTIPKHTTIFGCGNSSIIKAKGDIDLFKTVDYDKNISLSPGGFNLFIDIRNITLDGGYFTDTINYVKSDKTRGSGLKIFGNNFKLYNVTITNFPEYGLVLRNVKNFTQKEEPNLWYETLIVNCNILFNGKDGVNSDYLYDYNLIGCSINTNGQSNENYENKYSNFTIDHGACKMVNCHLSSLYGPVKPYYSLNVKRDCGMMNITNCHIEGAYTPIFVDSPLFNLTNSYVYGSFGDCDIVLNREQSFLSNVSFGPQVGDASHSYPEWKGAVKFTKGTHSHNIDCILVGTEFTSNFENVTFTTIKVRGYQTDVSKMIAPDPTVYEIQWDSFGFFNGKFARLKTFDNNNCFNATGFTNIELPNFANITGDVEMTLPQLIINGYENGTVSVNVNFSKKGQVLMVINRSNTDVPWTSATQKINGVNSGTFSKNSVHFFIGISENDYAGV